MEKTNLPRKPSEKEIDVEKKIEKIERKNSLFQHVKETKAKQKWHVNQMGEVIYKGHQSFQIMKQIQMGLRTVMDDTKTTESLTIRDFTTRTKLLCPRY